MHKITVCSTVMAALLLALSLLQSCTTLLRPGYSQELTALKPGNYRLDPAHASLVFKVDHLGLSYFVGRFNQFEASLNFDPENIQQSTLHAVIKTSSIDVNNAEFSKTLAGQDWLDSERWPEAIYTTRSAKNITKNQVIFSGMLALHGVEKPLDITVDFKGGANNLISGHYTIGFQASATINRSDFGIDSYASIVGENVLLEIHAEFQKQ